MALGDENSIDIALVRLELRSQPHLLLVDRVDTVNHGFTQFGRMRKPNVRA